MRPPSFFLVPANGRPPCESSALPTAEPTSVETEKKQQALPVTYQQKHQPFLVDPTATTRTSAVSPTHRKRSKRIESSQLRADTVVRLHSLTNNRTQVGRVSCCPVWDYGSLASRFTLPRFMTTCHWRVLCGEKTGLPSPSGPSYFVFCDQRGLRTLPPPPRSEKRRSSYHCIAHRPLTVCKIPSIDAHHPSRGRRVAPFSCRSLNEPKQNVISLPKMNSKAVVPFPPRRRWTCLSFSSRWCSWRRVYESRRRRSLAGEPSRRGNPRRTTNCRLLGARVSPPGVPGWCTSVQGRWQSEGVRPEPRSYETIKRTSERRDHS